MPFSIEVPLMEVQKANLITLLRDTGTDIDWLLMSRSTNSYPTASRTELEAALKELVRLEGESVLPIYQAVVQYGIDIPDYELTPENWKHAGKVTELRRIVQAVLEAEKAASI